MSKKKPIKPTPSLESIISIEEITVEPIVETIPEPIVEEIESTPEPTVEIVALEPQKPLQPHDAGFWDFHNKNR